MDYGRMIEPVGAPMERCMAVLFRAMAVGKGEEFGELALKSIFAEGRSPGEDEVLFGLAHRAGLSDEDVRASLADDSWRVPAEANRLALLGGRPVGRADLSGQRQAGALGPGSSVGARRGYSLRSRRFNSGDNKACRHLRRQALFRHAGSSAAVRDATLTELDGRKRRSERL